MRPGNHRPIAQLIRGRLQTGCYLGLRHKLAARGALLQMQTNGPPLRLIASPRRKFEESRPIRTIRLDHDGQTPLAENGCIPAREGNLRYPAAE